MHSHWSSISFWTSPAVQSCLLHGSFHKAKKINVELDVDEGMGERRGGNELDSEGKRGISFFYLLSWRTVSVFIHVGPWGSIVCLWQVPPCRESALQSLHGDGRARMKSGEVCEDPCGDLHWSGWDHSWEAWFTHSTKDDKNTEEWESIWQFRVTNI